MKKVRFNILSKLILIVGVCTFSSISFAQSGIGITANYQFYERIVTPNTVNPGESHSVGQVLNLLPGLGLKAWLGGDKVAFSAEGKVEYSPYAVHWRPKYYTGLGALSVPVLAKISYHEGGEFEAIYKDGYTVSLGVGMQWSTANFYFRPSEIAPVPWYSMYIIELNIGLGDNANNMGFFLRYGQGEDFSSVFKLGVYYDWNMLKPKYFSK